MKDKSGGSKGFGYVDFEGAESVTFALASQGDEMQLSGRILEVPHFTCFTGTKVQILTQNALRFPFTGTKVQILTQKLLLGVARQTSKG